MKNKKLIFLGFALVIVLVPIYVIFSSQDILNNGTFYKFRPQAYDPVDPFRGNYLRITYNTNGIPTNDEFEENDEVYVSIGVDKEGYAFFEEAFKAPPKKGDYLISKIQYAGGMERMRTGVRSRMNTDIAEEDVGEYKMSVTIEIPDNMCKYFINEDDAQDAEDAFRKHRNTAYVGIRIKNGQSRLQDIYIKGKPILEFLKKN